MTRSQQITLVALATGVIAVFLMLGLSVGLFTGSAEGERVEAEAPQAASPQLVFVVASPIAPAAPSVERTPTVLATPTVPRPSPTPTLGTVGILAGAPEPGTVAGFLSDYLQNRSYAQIVDAIPWTNTSVNRWQYLQELGGVTLWDYFASTFGQGFEEDWTSTRYGWLDDQGHWQPYRKESVRDANGRILTGYVIVDRSGTGVVDTMVFTQYSVDSRPTDAAPDLKEWGYLSHLGRIRIEVDDAPVYDVPVEEWFSGAAVCLPPELAQLFFWRYSDFGSSGTILPVPYQRHLKILVYGGTEKPKWFTFTGVTLTPGTPVKSFSGCLDAATRETIAKLAVNVSNPESYLDRLPGGGERQDVTLRVTATGSGVISRQEGSFIPLSFDGRGTILGLAFRIPKTYDVAALQLKITYGAETGVDMPVTAFFSDQDRVIQHRSAPIGVVSDPGDGNAYLFYCNYPLPYRNGISIELTTRAQPVNVRVRYVRSSESLPSTFRAVLDDFRSHPALRSLGPDYTFSLPGNGKLAGVVLVTRDQRYDARAIPGPPPDVFPGTIVFPMGYMESNVTLKDGRGTTRVYSGLEDFCGGGYNFDSDLGPGAKNLPFAGVLAFARLSPEKGYLSIFRYWNDLSAFRFQQGLVLSFQHGTWKNNFPVRYGLTIFYYADVP